MHYKTDQMIVLRPRTTHKRFEAKQDILYRLEHIADTREDDQHEHVMRWADDGGRHVD